MNQPEKRVTLNQLITKYKNGLLIPEIQRDYVMGAGGKKLEELLFAMHEKCKKFEKEKDEKEKSENEFDFSCIITHSEDEELLEIYDGQQRLTTLFLMALYTLRKENKREVSRFAGRYAFVQRPMANEILNRLVDEQQDINAIIDGIKVADHTSFSIKKLLEEIRKDKYQELTSDYLLNHVWFDIEHVGKQSETEQIFMDLNAGVKLTEYELYKSKLVYRVDQLKKGKVKQGHDLVSEQDPLEMWSYQMDNDWMDFFDLFSDDKHPAEEYEIAFIRYCIHMIRIPEENVETKETKPEEVGEKVIEQVYGIMQEVIKCTDQKSIKYFIGELVANEEEQVLNNYLKFSRDKEDKEKLGKIDDLRGVFWKLEDDSYEWILCFVIKKVLLDASKNKELLNDVLLWCYITTLGWRKDIQNEYLRMIKIILNNNVATNKEAWYGCPETEQFFYHDKTYSYYYPGKIYYSKYTAYAMPQYYGKHLDIEDTDCKDRHNKTFLFNNWAVVEKNINISNIPAGDRKSITESLMKQMMVFEEHDPLKVLKWIKARRNLINQKKYNCYEVYTKKENEVWGIISAIARPDRDNTCYLEKVYLVWPSNTNNKKSEECWVKLKDETDLLRAIDETGLFEKKDEIVKKTEEEFGKDFVEKCYWTGEKYGIWRVHQPVANNSKTYRKIGSTAEGGYRITWEYKEQPDGNFSFIEQRW